MLDKDTAFISQWLQNAGRLPNSSLSFYDDTISERVYQVSVYPYRLPKFYSVSLHVWDTDDPLQLGQFESILNNIEFLNTEGIRSGEKCGSGSIYICTKDKAFS